MPSYLAASQCDASKKEKDCEEALEGVKMIEFEQACEIASRHFGMNTSSSCLDGAWEARDGWWFAPAGACEESGRSLLNRYLGHPSDAHECGKVFVWSDCGLLQSLTGGPLGADVTEEIPKRYRV